MAGGVDIGVSEAGVEEMQYNSSLKPWIGCQCISRANWSDAAYGIEGNQNLE